MLILGIESTCDETSAAVVRDGQEVLANIVSSSVDLHERYKGVVPEIAAREQVKVIVPVIEEACQVSSVMCQDVDAIAVAYGPGLIGSLLIGVETVKTLALVLSKPLVPVNHLMGHVYANWLVDESVSRVPRVSPRFAKASRGERVPRAIKRKALDTPTFPLVALIVSGGHTDLLLMTDHGQHKWLGGTRDDAAGEAFDKVARLLGLGYPGGPEVERVARNFQFPISNFQFPRPMISAKGGPASGWDSGDFDFSFSGLKTAVANLVKTQEHLRGESSSHLEGEITARIAHEFQQAVVDVLVTKTMRAAQKFGAKSIVVGGGVAANSDLRYRMSDAGRKNETAVFFPSKELSVDNGAMIAGAAFYNFKPISVTKLQADPGLYF